MAFLRGVPVSDAESIIYNHWGIIAFLVQHGFSYESVMEMTETDMTLLMATLLAMDQRKADTETRVNRIGH